ncbi:hypothetical protein PAXRUDRAFT_63040, partial [Paxillus rubicundulus Ve08.2h10]
RNGVFVVDRSTINLFVKLSLYGETFYDQKSNYSLILVIMVHNPLIVDYALGEPGSIHDAHTFQNTHI